jgi:quinoprotein dehydrogenase-associated probable ABC transporter substrate-binding protein
MSSACNVFARALAGALLLGMGGVAQARSIQANPPPAGSSDPASKVLRVCADPNNLPFSNRAQKGFENALADLVAHDLKRTVAYTWFPQRRGFIRNTLAAGRCDVVIGVPAHYGMAATTQPYYRSSYVFVTRKARHLDIHSFDDPRLAHLRIGLHAFGDDYNNVPPAQVLAAHGIVGNITGYSIYGDYSKPDPPRELIDAVAHGDVDIAIAWGPLAGYFAAHEDPPLDVRIAEQDDPRNQPMTFAIAMGVRKDDPALRNTLDGFIEHHTRDIVRLLQRYHVPLLAGADVPARPGG